MKKRQTEKDDSLKRIHRKSILFNTREIKAIEHYCKKYKIKNKSKFMREIIITSVLKKFDDDYPSLFEKNPTLFNQNLKRKI